jgi:hypothetical protein
MAAGIKHVVDLHGVWAIGTFEVEVEARPGREGVTLVATFYDRAPSPDINDSFRFDGADRLLTWDEIGTDDAPASDRFGPISPADVIGRAARDLAAECVRNNVHLRRPDELYTA